jgi:FtsP/CotA-like multicopper oxidase with cupredoxin domain
MNHSTTKLVRGGARAIALATTLLAAVAWTGIASAAVHGITAASGTPVFNLTASEGNTSQPDGAFIYSWGYGCTGATAAGFAPANVTAANCPLMQIPGPTLIVTEGDLVTVNLTNNLPAAAGSTSIVFPGMTVATSGGTDGLLTKEAVRGGVVQYQFTAGKPGTYAYYSGSQAQLQIEMGLYGAIVVLPSAASTTAANCPSHQYADATWSLAKSAYAVHDTCYDREYLFQFAELSSNIHDEVKAQVDACTAARVANASYACPQILATLEPYRPNYFLINGRSMPDIMDVAYAPAYPNQPYNGNPHMHPGELVLMRVIGQGRWQHPFHFHGNHARVIARDGNTLVSASDASKLAGPLLFTIPTVSGQTVDAIFSWTGQGLNWDVYGSEPHTCNGAPLPATAGDPAAQSAGFDSKTHEYCLDHGKPIPATPPDPSIVVNGQWYAGTPYLGLQAANATPEAPGTLNQNPQGGYAYMWHSHNEREITTNDVFPGGMLMMLLIDPLSWTIDETL